MNLIEDTIASVASPIGVGGVAIVRVSGKKSIEIATAMTGIKKFAPREMVLTTVKTPYFKDEGLVVYFKAPNSFTGEDSVEFQVHGGLVLANGVLKECLRLGARLARKGEFSQRAFVNGKMSLEQAEGLIDMIEAGSEKEIEIGYRLLNGEFLKEIKDAQSKLTTLLAEIDVSIDYPSEDIDYLTTEKVGKVAIELEKSLGKIVQTYQEGKLLKHGLNCIILGKPNAGKSSLMNALANEDVAIVTEVPGTTRDLIKHSFLFEGNKINLTDTAGLRATEDEVEQIGVARAKNAIQGNDVVVYVAKGDVPLSIEDEENLEELKGKNLIVVLSKADFQPVIKEEYIRSIVPKAKIVHTSTISKTGINELKVEMNKFFKTIELKTHDIILTNARHHSILQQVVDLLNIVKKDYAVASLDCLADELKQAYQLLGEITGETSSEAVVHEIFSKFCLGK